MISRLEGVIEPCPYDEGVIDLYCDNRGYAIRYLGSLESRRAVLYIMETFSANAGVTLYGFDGKMERELAKLLCKVDGIGGSVSQKIVTNTPVDELITVIATKNIDALSKCKGVSKGKAQLIIDKLSTTFSTATTQVSPKFNEVHLTAFGALVALGYKISKIKEVASTQSLPDNESEIIKQLLPLLK